MPALKYADTAKAFAVLLLLVLLLYLTLKLFYVDFNKITQFKIFLTAVPVFFISITEAGVSYYVYGSRVVWDSNSGLVFPNVNSIEAFALQCFALICLFTVLVLNHTLSRLIVNERKIKLFEQKAYEQSIYINEVMLRCDRTRSFRHDIKNHLSVLRELLKANHTQKAYNYLLRLEDTAQALDLPVYTGNAAVDALLTGKIPVLNQSNIEIRYDLKKLAESEIDDIDLCIVLSNAIDNAANELNCLEISNKYINISGNKKGNFYLLKIENPCDKRKNTVPKEGIGLSNIRETAKKYNGRAETEISEGVFKLSVLFVILKQ